MDKDSNWKVIVWTENDLKYKTETANYNLTLKIYQKTIKDILKNKNKYVEICDTNGSFALIKVEGIILVSLEKVNE